jgi:hypothetical protein
MEPFEKDELSEGELDRLLGEWNAPTAPARRCSRSLTRPGGEGFGPCPSPFRFRSRAF